MPHSLVLIFKQITSSSTTVIFNSIEIVVLLHTSNNCSKMPVPVKYKCPKCNGETDIDKQKCLYCMFEEYLKSFANAKHIPSNMYSKK